jgi:hypothetical protein
MVRNKLIYRVRTNTNYSSLVSPQENNGGEVKLDYVPLNEDLGYVPLNEELPPPKGRYLLDRILLKVTNASHK